MSKVSLINGHIDGAETCVCCGRDIPSDSQYCVICGKTEPRDMVEVVRCKDCKYYQPKNSLGTQGICACGEKDMNYSGEFYPYEDDFCSYGERKEVKE